MSYITLPYRHPDGGETPLPPYLLFCLETQLQPYLQKWSISWFPRFRLHDQQATLRIYDGDEEIHLPRDLVQELQQVVDEILGSTLCRLVSVSDFPNVSNIQQIFERIIPPSGIRWHFDNGTIFVQLPAEANYLELYNLLTVGITQLVAALENQEVPSEIIGAISKTEEYTDLSLDPSLTWTFTK